MVPGALWLAISGSLAATHSVESVTGVFEDRAVLTVSGAGFGGGPEVLVYDDFEAGVANTKVPTSQNSEAALGRWTHKCGAFPEGCHDPYYTTDEAHGGSFAFAADHDEPNSESHNSLGVALGGADEVFISLWVYVDPDDCIPGHPGCNGTNWKMTWIFGGTNTADNDRIVHATDPGKARIASNSDVDSYYFGNYTGYTKGKWLHFEYWLFADGGSQHGAVGAWGIDGANNARWEKFYLSLDTSVQNEDGQGDGVFDGYGVAHIGGYGTVQTQGRTFRSLWDDVYVSKGSNAQARVLIANAASLGQSTNVALCTTGGPDDAWGDDEIVCTVRAGSFTGGDVWVFVIDGDGEVSTGHGPHAWGAGGETGTDTGADDTSSGSTGEGGSEAGTSGGDGPGPGTDDDSGGDGGSGAVTGAGSGAGDDDESGAGCGCSTRAAPVSFALVVSLLGLVRRRRGARWD